MSNQQTFNSFSEFYPYYLEEHSDVTCRRLHFVGSLLVLIVALWALTTGKLLWLLVLPVIGYGFAWVGHFKFEKNRPATFKYPLYSLMGDWVMFRDMLIGRIRF
ncbi:MAG: Mpo1-like protein [Marinobacter sp.]|nr:Mpo1-like protein [Marinobacter sp.]